MHVQAAAKAREKGEYVLPGRLLLARSAGRAAHMYMYIRTCYQKKRCAAGWKNGARVGGMTPGRVKTRHKFPDIAVCQHKDWLKGQGWRIQKHVLTFMADIYVGISSYVFFMQERNSQSMSDRW
jgi:hypothetical protein